MGWGIFDTTDGREPARPLPSGRCANVAAFAPSRMTCASLPNRRIWSRLSSAAVPPCENPKKPKAPLCIRRSLLCIRPHRTKPACLCAPCRAEKAGPHRPHRAGAVTSGIGHTARRSLGRMPSYAVQKRFSFAVGRIAAQGRPGCKRDCQKKRNAL